jgi:hypothetical protein
MATFFGRWSQSAVSLPLIKQWELVNMTEQTTGIKVYDKAQREAYGQKVAEGWNVAWNFDTKRKGAVDKEGNFYHTLPLNGWRERNLAEEVTGERDGSIWREPGKTMIVDLKTLQELPGFDQFYYDFLADLAFASKVARIEVIEVDPGYGSHIAVMHV